MAVLSAICVSSNNASNGSHKLDSDKESPGSEAKLLGFTKMDEADDMFTEDKVIIDIGGSRFVTSTFTLMRVPKTRLYNIASNFKDSSESRELFFDRNPFLFEYILDFYRSGELHLPQNRCGQAIKNELKYWGLDEGCVSSCCWKTYTDSTESVKTQAKISKEFLFLSQTKIGKENGFRARVWSFLASPESSVPAKIYSMISSLLVVLSMCMLMLSTLPEVRVELEGMPESSNETKHTTALHMLKTTSPHISILYIDLAVAILLCIEFIAKLAVCPLKIAFLRSFSTFSDIIHFLPVIALHFVHRLDDTIWPSLQNPGFVIFFQSLFALRVLRLHRVACYIRGFKILVLALKASCKELFLLIALVLLTALVFAFAIFYVELASQNSFSNAFLGFWWALITMTSVGYGDLYPLSPLGYVVGVICAFAGIILISLPVPMVANNFNLYYAYKEEPDPLSSTCRWRGDFTATPKGLNAGLVNEMDSENNKTNCKSKREVNS